MPTYLSEEALSALKSELETRKKITRGEIAEDIGAAKELGDISENFEYQEAKERQSLNEARIFEIEAMIHDTVIVEESTGGSVITLGTTFIVTVDGEEKTFPLVGSTEADPMSGRISNESPLGAAFFGRKVGDSVEIDVLSGKIVYTIIKIQ